MRPQNFSQATGSLTPSAYLGPLTAALKYSFYHSLQGPFVAEPDTLRMKNLPRPQTNAVPDGPCAPYPDLVLE